MDNFFLLLICLFLIIAVFGLVSALVWGAWRFCIWCGAIEGEGCSAVYTVNGRRHYCVKGADHLGEHWHPMENGADLRWH